MAIGRKLRFEVFKRDSFTCQYCGRSAPEVLLEADHIEPKAKGGKDTIFNLITACKDCNGGKSAIPLSDQSVLAKQKRQLAELQERKEQLEMMFEWQKSLMNLDDHAVDLAAKLFEGISSWSKPQ
jgi:5-methylcytosine-specific restriction endonuclease McrA